MVNFNEIPIKYRIRFCTFYQIQCFDFCLIKTYKLISNFRFPNIFYKKYSFYHCPWFGEEKKCIFSDCFSTLTMYTTQFMLTEFLFFHTGAETNQNTFRSVYSFIKRIERRLFWICFLISDNQFGKKFKVCLNSSILGGRTHSFNGKKSNTMVPGDRLLYPSHS